MTTRININTNSESGFAAAEFLFTFVLVISCGLVVFALTFSLMTVEIAQYITWSSARAYSAGNISKEASIQAGQRKFSNLAAAFPLLSNSNNSDWFKFSLSRIGSTPPPLTSIDPGNRLGDETRHPWSGVSSSIELSLFKSLRLPFLGPITNDEQLFNFQLHAFLFRNPSQEECKQFYDGRYREIKNLPDFNSASFGNEARYFAHEDNGC